MENMIILKDRIVKKTSNSDEHQIGVVKLDLKGLSDGDKEEYMARSIWIACQAKMRELTEAELDAIETAGTYTWAVPKPGTRITLSPEEQMKRKLEGMTREEKIAYLTEKGLL